MPEAMLSGVRVLDISGPWGSACSAYLASLGAEVAFVEPPGGAAARKLASGEPDPLWLARHFGKSSVAADLDSAAGRASVARLLEAADILIDSFSAEEAAARDLDPAILAERLPRLIHVSITPFGREGPGVGRRANELVVSALGGTLAAVGYEDRAPVKEAGDACIFHASAMAASGAMFALYERGQSERGQHIDVSVQEVAASRMTSAFLAWQFDRRALTRSGVHVSYGTARVRYVWELKDGYCFHGLMSGRTGAPANAALSKWMDEAGFDNPMRDVDWLSYDRGALPAPTRLSWEAAIDAFFRSRTKADIASEGRRRGINAAVAMTPADLLEDEHLAARGFFATTQADGKTVRAPSRTLNVGAAAPLAPPPAPGAQTEAVTSAWRPGAGQVRYNEPAPLAAPLAGVKVLDFSWALVGSLTTKALADCGAEVIKIESAKRPCLTRLDVQVAASRRGNFNDKPWFIHLNTSKRSLSLNMKHPRAREIIEPLIDWADVVVENFSPGTMASLGLDYERLRARKPNIIMASGSVYGQSGPLTREWGVDGTGAALSGRLYLTGYPDRPPVNPSFAPYGDVVLPPLLSAAIAAALDHRRRTGEGRHIDASMWEACVQQMAGPLIQQQVNGAPTRRGNRDDAVLHQGVYPTRGDDRWIAISWPDQRAWAQFAQVMHGEWPAPAGGDAALDRLDAQIAAATGAFDGYELMGRLQAAGVPAGVVQTAADLMERDPQLAHRNFMPTLANAALGAFAHQATPIKMSRMPLVMRTAPDLGEANAYVARDLIGLSTAAYDDLVASNLFE